MVILKQALLDILGDADARIPDGKAYPLAAVDLLEKFGANIDLAPLGKLDRIADKIIEDLR